MAGVSLKNLPSLPLPSKGSLGGMPLFLKFIGFLIGVCGLLMFFIALDGVDKPNGEKCVCGGASGLMQLSAET